MHVLALILVTMALFAGCASTDGGSRVSPPPSPAGTTAGSPAINQATQCQRVGGTWRPVPGVCEQVPGRGR